MKNALIAAVVLLFACGMALAQNQQADTTNSAGTKEITVTGCLQGGPDHYTILSHEGKTIQIQSKNPELDKLVGHTIAATGTQAPGTTTTTNATSEAPNGATNTGSEAVLTAGAIADLSPNCDQSSTRAKPKY